MSQPNQENQNNNSENNPEPTVGTVDTHADSSIQKPQNSHNSGQHTYSYPIVLKRIKNFFNKNKKPAMIANWISLGMLLVTGILAWYTYKLFHQTLDQTKAATKSANAAVTADSIVKIQLDSQRSAKKQSDIADANRVQREIDAFTETRNFYKTSIDKQQKAIDDNAENNQKFFDRASASLKLQDSSLRETQKEFITEKKPFLQVEITSINVLDTIPDGITINFTIKSLSARPIEGIESAVSINYTDKRFNGLIMADNPIQNIRLEKDMRYYTINGNPPISITYTDVKKEVRKAFKKNDLDLIFFGRVKYLDYTIAKPRIMILV